MKRTVIIPAAGLASRMKPLSRGVSKAMIPVNGRPLISYVIETIFQEKSVNEVVIVENELSDISEFVARVYPEKPIKCVIQPEKLGPLHAINIGLTAVENADNNITIWLGDTICLDRFDYSENFLAVYPVEDPHRWCLVDENGVLYDKPDGPVPTDKALIGIYNFINRERFNEAMKTGMKKPTHKGEHQIAALLDAYMKRGPMPLTIAKEWYDCGELNTYYESKARLLKNTARSFNKIEVNTFYGTVMKSSSSKNAEKQHKIELEKKWFASLDETQALFCPRVLKDSYGCLKMSLEPGIALNEVLVYDNLRPDVWHDIIRKILRIHHDVFNTWCRTCREDQMKACFDTYVIRNLKRLDDIEDLVNSEDFHIVRDFVTQTGLELCVDPHWSAIMHGDSHTGNIIYDPHSGNLKFVDPRGSFGGIESSEGDLRYDMGKLLQDFYCGYAMMMAGRYRIVNNEVIIDWVGDTGNLGKFLENELAEECAVQYDVKLLKKLAIVLLVTAIPFHTDSPDRILAFYLRALGLIKEINAVHTTARKA